METIVRGSNHSKRFPLCEFLLNKRGIGYVLNIVEKNIYLKQSTSSNLKFFKEAHVLRNCLEIEEIADSYKKNYSKYNLGIRQKKKNNEKSQDAEEMKSQRLVGKAIEMDFEKWKLKSVLTDCFRSINSKYSNFRKFLDYEMQNRDHEKEDNIVELTSDEAFKFLERAVCLKSLKQMKNFVFLCAVI